MAQLTRKQIDLVNEIIDKNEFISVIKQTGITIEDKPSIVTPRPGYKWVPTQTTAKGSITWIEEVDPNAEGTADKPITFVMGMAVWENYYYTNGQKRYVCVKSGNPTELIENEYFTEF